MTDYAFAVRWDVVWIALKVGAIGLAVWWVVEQCVELLAQRRVETTAEGRKRLFEVKGPR